MAKIAPKGKKVVGTKKKDKITWASTKPWKKALTVKAGAGNDVINFKKSGYKNTIYGEAGNDKIYGGKKNDKIYGGKGNDTIQAGKGSNTLYFSKGDGKDTVLKGGGTDTLVFKTEKNINNLKISYSGNDAVIAYDGGTVVLKDYKLGGHSAKFVQVGSVKKAVNDLFKPTSAIVDGIYVLTGTDNNDSLVGKDEYNCLITGMGGNDTIIGGNGNDTLYGTSGNNILKGGAGHDTIYSGTGNNTIYGGYGNNYYDVKNGKNTIVFDILNSGITDKIVNFGPNDTLYLPNATIDDMSRVTFDYDESNCLDFGNWSLHIRIQDYSNSTSNGYIKFGNAAPIRMSEFLASKHMYIYGNEANIIENTIMGGQVYTKGGNDTITNVSYGDGYTLFLDAGDGDDSITGVGDCSTINGGAGNDTITSGYGYETYLRGGDGNDVIISQYSSTSSNSLGGDGDDYIEGGYDMRGDGGNDTIKSYSSGKTYINGGIGNDELYRNENNTDQIYYTFSSYDNGGNDLLYDNLGGQSILYFDGLYSTSLRNEFYNSLRYYVSEDEKDLIIRYKARDTQSYDNHSITIKNYFNIAPENQSNLIYRPNGDSSIYTVASDIAEKGYTGIEIVGGDGSQTLTGTKYNDTIISSSDNSTIIGGAGDDILQRKPDTSGWTTFKFAYTGDGNDIIENAFSSLSKIKFTGLTDETQSDFYNSLIYEISGNDLIIRYADDSSIKVKDYMTAGEDNTRLRILDFEDNHLYVPEILEAKGVQVRGTTGNDTLTGLNEYKTELYGYEGNDSLTGGYIMVGGAGNDTITSSATGEPNNITVINGGEGDDEIYIQNTHNQTVRYDYSLAQYNGSDIIFDNLSGERVLNFTGQNGQIVDTDYLDTIVYTRYGNNLVINYKDQTADENWNSILIKDFQTLTNQDNLYYAIDSDTIPSVKSYIQANGYSEISGTENDDSIIGTDLPETVMALGGDDVITGGKGNDILIGGDGNNTYIYNDGDGVDTIISTSDGDILQFNNYNAADLDLLKSGKDLYITHSGNKIINLKDFFNPQTLSRLQLKFADNSTKDIFEFINDKGHSSEFNTYFVDYNTGIGLNGTDADEIFVFGCGDVMAGKGNDSLYTYGAESDFTGEHVIYAGDGNDVIYQRGSNFNIQFLSATFKDLTAEGNWWMDGDDLVIKYDGVNTLTIKDYWSLDSGAQQFRTLRENAVEENLWPDIDPGNYSWNSFFFYFGKNPIAGTNDADTLVGTDEDNHISAGAGNDIITGGKGNDILYGYLGTDTFVFNKGDGKDIVASAEIIKFNDVDISELDVYDGPNSRLYIQYGENDIIRFYYSNLNKIVDKNGNEYSFENIDMDIDSAGNYLIAGRKDSCDMINVSNAGANCIIFAQGGENDEYKDNINISSGTATIMVKKQEVYTLINGTGSSNTTINFMDTTLNDVSLSNKQIHIIFNVSNTYNKDNNGLYAFGDVSFVDNDNLALWSSGQNYKGITVTNNSVQTIKTKDNYTLTNGAIADLAQSVAGWLTTDDRNYGSVNDVLASNNETDITALIAQFDNANWTNAG